MKKEPLPVVHPFAPVWDAHSRILILGSFPSVRSREIGFYYGHPQNRFWRVLAALYDAPVPLSTEDRRAFALRHRIALWDALHSCRIVGSSDSSIQDPIANDIAALVRHTNIRRIYCNGKRSYAVYQTYCAKDCGIDAIPLPSTSAANAAYALEQLVERWRVILA